MSYPRSSTTPVYSAKNQVELIQGGASYFQQLLQLINSATISFHLQVYIYDSDETGTAVGRAICDAAERGVKVYLLLDGYASQNLSDAFKEMLKKSGVHLKWFKPLFKSKNFYFGRRLHHKIAVADGCRALVGGINVSNRYNDLPDQPAWLDWAVSVSGEAAEQLDRLCVSFWNRSGLPFKGIAKHTPCKKEWLPVKECLVRVRRNDWVNRKIEISRSYQEMFKRAENEITILCSYFLPGRLIRMALLKAIRKGVKTTLIIAGDSDISLTKAAERYWYPWLLRLGIRIYEYKPRILHGKIAVFDQKWVTVGSYNINDISAYASVELNLDILDPDFGEKTKATLHAIIQNDCIEITSDRFHKTNHILFRFWHWLNYELYRLIFFLFTFYFRQRKKE